MKYFIILLSFFAVSCVRGESFYKKDCIYNSWADGGSHCSRYNLVAVDPETKMRNHYQYYNQGYPRYAYYPVRYY